MSSNSKDNVLFCYVYEEFVVLFCFNILKNTFEIHIVVVVLCHPAISHYNAIHLLEMKIFPLGLQSGNQRAIILPQ